MPLPIYPALALREGLQQAAMQRGKPDPQRSGRGAPQKKNET
jgi:hypothetical protein